MNILFINLYTEMGGNEVAVLNLIKSLDRSRFTPVMMFNRRGRFVDQAEAAGARTVLIGYESVMLQRLIVPAVCWNNMKASYEIYKYLKSSEIDLIQCSDVLTLLLIVIPVLRLRIPVVYTVVFYYEWIRVLLFNLLALLIVERIIANSFGVSEDLGSKSFFLKKRISVIHNGVDTSLFRPRARGEKDALRTELRLPASTKIVGMVSRFDPVKGHAAFLRAASALRKERSDLTFVVAGGLLMSDSLPSWKTYRDNIMKLAGDLGLGEKVVFLDHRNDIHVFMRSLDVLVCPSTREAFGLVVPETLASGVPVVVGRGVGALEAVKGEAGVYIAETGDSDSFVQGIRQALGDAEVRKGLPLQPSSAFMANVSWNRYGIQFGQIYERIFGTNS